MLMKLIENSHLNNYSQMKSMNNLQKINQEAQGIFVGFVTERRKRIDKKIIKK